MNEGLIPRRYAKALYKVAGERKAEKEMYDLMVTLVASFRANPALTEVIDNPFQSTVDKLGLLTTAAGAAPGQTLYADFLQLLVTNSRLGMVEAIAAAYIALYREANHIKVVHLTTASALTPDDEKRLRELVSAHLGEASMEYSSEVDPSLIGGFTIAVDNERLDASISNELKQLRLNLLSKQAI